MSDLHIPPTHPQQGLLERLADLERHIREARHIGMMIPTGAGAPSHAAEDGSLYIDKTAVKLYMRVNGDWVLA